jgi:Bacterial PH domain
VDAQGARTAAPAGRASWEESAVSPGQAPEPPGGGGGNRAASEPGVIPVTGADVAPDAAFGQTKTFRLPGAVVVWWIWVVFAAANIIDLAVDGRDHTGAVITLALILITGLVYACALRPSIVTDAEGLTMHNPFRDHRVPWGSVVRVDLRESVQVHVAADAGKKEKILYSWALFAPRRARYRSFRGGPNFSARPRSPFGMRYASSPTSTSGYGKMPQEAQELQKQNTAQIMANELDGLARQARERGVSGGRRVVTWPWRPLAAVLIPAIALVVVALVR